MGILKIVLILFNTIFVICGVALAIVGGIATWGTSILTQSKAVTAQLEKTLGTDYAQNLGGMGIEDIIEPFGLGIFVLGLFILLISIFGCCGAKKNNRICLLIYMILISVILAAEIAVVIAFYGTNIFSDSIGKVWKESTMKLYAGDDVTSITDKPQQSVSSLVNLMNRYFKCCGVDSYMDLASAPNWNKEVSFGGTTYKNVKAPSSCCVWTAEFPDGTPKYAPGCFMTPNKTTSYYSKGCLTAIKDLVISTPIALIVIASVMGFEIVLINLAACSMPSKE